MYQLSLNISTEMQTCERGSAPNSFHSQFSLVQENGGREMLAPCVM